MPESFRRPDLEFSTLWLWFVSCRIYFIMHQIGRRRFYLSNIHEMDVNRFYAQTNSCVMTRFEPKYRQNICNPESSGSFSASRPILKDFDDPSIDRKPCVLFLSLCLAQERLFAMSETNQTPASHGVRSLSRMFAARLKLLPEDCASAKYSWSDGPYPCEIFRGRS